MRLDRFTAAPPKIKPNRDTYQEDSVVPPGLHLFPPEIECDTGGQVRR